MPGCFGTTPVEINLFKTMADGTANIVTRGKLRIETESGEDITGHRIDTAGTTQESFTGKCRLVLGGSIRAISFLITMEDAVWFFAGTFSGPIVSGVYYIISKVGVTALVEPGDTGTWGGTQT